MLVFFKKLKTHEIFGQVSGLILSCLFSVKDGSEWLWMGSIHKNIQLMLVLFKAPFLVLHFSYYTSTVTFLMVPSLLLLSMLMIQIRCSDHSYRSEYTSVTMIRSSDLSWQLELVPECESDVREDLEWGWKWLANYNAEKARLASSDQSNNCY